MTVTLGGRVPSSHSQGSSLVLLEHALTWDSQTLALSLPSLPGRPPASPLVLVPLQPSKIKSGLYLVYSLLR